MGTFLQRLLPQKWLVDLLLPGGSSSCSPYSGASLHFQKRFPGCLPKTKVKINRFNLI